MMKVLHICIFQGYDDNLSYQENLLSQYHKKMGLDVYFIASQTSIDEKKRFFLTNAGRYTNNYGINVVRLKNTVHNPHFARFFDKTIGLYEGICKIHPDIIFVHNPVGKDVRHIVKYAKHNKQVRVYADIHRDFYNSPVNTIKQKINAFYEGIFVRQICNVVQVIWGTIPWRVQYLQEIYKIPTEKTDLLIMGVDESKIVNANREKIKKDVRSRYDIPTDAFIVVTGGVLDKRKQQDLLLEAISRIDNSNLFIIVFGIPTDEMKSVLTKYKGNKRIKMVGWMNSDAVLELLLASDLAFFPGTHSVLWEQAAACEIPLVVRHWVGIEHLDINGNALLLDNISVESIMQTVNSLLFTPVYYEMKEKSKIAAKHFYYSEIAKKSIGIE